MDDRIYCGGKHSYAKSGMIVRGTIQREASSSAEISCFGEFSGSLLYCSIISYKIVVRYHEFILMRHHVPAIGSYSDAPLLTA